MKSFFKLTAIFVLLITSGCKPPEVGLSAIKKYMHRPVENDLIDEAREQYLDHGASKGKKSSMMKEEDVISYVQEEDPLGPGDVMYLDDNLQEKRVSKEGSKYVVHKHKEPSKKKQRANKRQAMASSPYKENEMPDDSMLEDDEDDMKMRAGKRHVSRSSSMRAADPVKKSLTYKKRAKVKDLDDREAQVITLDEEDGDENDDF